MEVIYLKIVILNTQAIEETVFSHHPESAYRRKSSTSENIFLEVIYFLTFLMNCFVKTLRQPICRITKMKFLVI